MTRWREYVVPALAGNDISLVGNLMELDVLCDVQTINRYLQNFAEQRGWEATNLRTWGLEEEMSFHDTEYSLVPPRSLRKLWAHGVVGWTLEYGLELHTAVLAVLGRQEELSHRLWRGQSELVLPLVDRTRLEVCKYLTSFHGPDWPVREYAPESPQEEEIVRKNPLACQLGHLEFILKNSSFISSKQRLTTPISLCRWIRNQIAHYRPIAFKDFENFLREVENSITFNVLGAWQLSSARTSGSTIMFAGGRMRCFSGYKNNSRQTLAKPKPFVNMMVHFNFFTWNLFYLLVFLY